MRSLVQALQRWYTDLPLSKKIYLPNFLIILLLLLFSGFISRVLVSDFLLNRVIENTRQSLDIIIQSIDSVLNDVETGALRVASDPMVQGILMKAPEKEQIEGLDQYFLVKSILDKTLYIRNYIDSISVYRLDGSSVGSGYINYGKVLEKSGYLLYSSKW